MKEVGHFSADIFAALFVSALDEQTRREVLAHLATGCAQCLDEQRWVNRTFSLARSDESQLPPPHVLARAIRILAVERASTPVRGTLLHRIRALPIFDNRGGAVALAGVRGPGDAVRQVLYGVESAHLEIDVQVQRRSEAAGGLVAVRGQVFVQEGSGMTVAGLPVTLVSPIGITETTTSAQGAFHFEGPEDADLLVLQVSDAVIEVPVPQL